MKKLKRGLTYHALITEWDGTVEAILVTKDSTFVELDYTKTTYSDSTESFTKKGVVQIVPHQMLELLDIKIAGLI
jgi:predicted nucleic acid-binding OB-fold protein